VEISDIMDIIKIIEISDIIQIIVNMAIAASCEGPGGSGSRRFLPAPPEALALDKLAGAGGAGRAGTR
jgi:hypothetical protein